jgi:hypothetical protein
MDIPVRWLTFFMEEGLYRRTQWVVFMPRGETLWAQPRPDVGEFMQCRSGAGACRKLLRDVRRAKPAPSIKAPSSLAPIP